MMRVLPRLCGFVATAFLQLGCTNKPGALEMRVTSDKPVYIVGESPVLRASLLARGGNVCLDRNPISVCVTRVEDGFELCKRREVMCGTSPLMLLQPILISFALVDVCDLLGRYDVILEGREMTEVADTAKTGFWVCEDFQFSNGRHVACRADAFTPGTYRVQARCPKGNGILAPIFWTVYPHEAKAETEFRVVAEDTKTDIGQ